MLVATLQSLWNNGNGHTEWRG